MELLVDGIIFQKDPHGGVARLYEEILPLMCDIDPDLRITIFIDGPLRRELPIHAQISVRKAPPVKRTIRVQGVWRRLFYPFRRLASQAWNITRGAWLGRGEGVIWHSTYYTLPQVWEGKQVVTVYDMIYEHYPDLYQDPLDDLARELHRRCIEQADAVICISEATRQDVLHYYPQAAASKLHVIPLAASPVFRLLSESERSSDPPAAGMGKEDAFLLFVGSRFAYKNFEGLLEAYSNWPGSDRVKLVVVGALWHTDEIQLLGKLGISGKVFLLSKVDDEALRQLYSRALAFISPSLYEGFGIPLLEAMACGCPVIASRIPSSLEVAGECALYFEPSQPETLLVALDQVLAGNGIPEMVKLGLERARRFSWESTARQTLDVYRSLCD